MADFAAIHLDEVLAHLHEVNFCLFVEAKKAEQSGGVQNNVQKHIIQEFLYYFDGLSDLRHAVQRLLVQVEGNQWD